VVSGCGAVTDIFEGHHFTKTLAEGVAAAITPAWIVLQPAAAVQTSALC
jgi:hypothetical protein